LQEDIMNFEPSDEIDTDYLNGDANDDNNVSPTSHLLAELQLFGYRPFEDAPDPRPLPEDRHVRGAIADIFDALIVALQDNPNRLQTRLDTPRQGRTVQA
jgi:hypothetical protein